VPAILYGHGEENVPLAVRGDVLLNAVRHGTRLVQLSGSVEDQALIRDVQWDTYGLEVLHVDFARVSADERIHVRIALELKGEAPGIREGGTVEHLIHDVEIECPAGAIPEKLILSVNELHLNGEITLSDVKVPENVKVLMDPDTIVVHCFMQKEEAEEALAEPGPGEPEVIGRKVEEDEEAEE
jgi:large subunit ribosomal protein L25